MSLSRTLALSSEAVRASRLLLAQTLPYPVSHLGPRLQRFADRMKIARPSEAVPALMERDGR